MQLYTVYSQIVNPFFSFKMLLITSSIFIPITHFEPGQMALLRIQISRAKPPRIKPSSTLPLTSPYTACAAFVSRLLREIFSLSYTHVHHNLFFSNKQTNFSLLCPPPFFVLARFFRALGSFHPFKLRRSFSKGRKAKAKEPGGEGFHV